MILPISGGSLKRARKYFLTRMHASLLAQEAAAHGRDVAMYFREM